jgi:sugar phosphate isomerase/epimerase
MELGIFAKTFPGTEPLSVLKAVSDAGYTCAQYNMACSGLPSMPDEITHGHIRAIAETAEQRGVRLAALSGTYNMIHPDRVVREDGHRRLEVLAKSCAGMRTGLITLCTGTRDATDQWKEHPDNNSTDAWQDLLESMEVAIEIADRYNVYLGIEPELANVVNSAQKARRLIDELESSRIKIVLDPANLFEVETRDEQRTIVSTAIDLLADRIALAHAKDRTADGKFATAGKGVLDYSHYLQKLASVGFQGAIITHGLDASEAHGVSQFLQGKLQLLGAPR